jgi:hypothetical protein
VYCAVRCVDADDLVERAQQLQQKLMAVEVDEAGLANPGTAHCLPYPSIDELVPERMSVANQPQQHRRTFEYMGRERLTDTMKAIGSLTASERSLADFRQKKEATETVSQAVFMQMLMYGTPGWGKVAPK